MHIGELSIVELRRYILRRDRRDALIELFERELLEPQEDVGMTVVGQFRDLDRADRFVWLRAFPEATRRAAALAAFYDGPVWRKHRDDANATMLDSDDVFLLRPVPGTLDLGNGAARSPRASAGGAGAGFAVLAVVPFDGPDAAEQAVGTFDATLAPRIAAAGGRVVARLVTASVANDFPRLPVREGEHVAVWIAACADAATLEALAELAADGLGGRPPEILRLQPTARSALTGG